MLHNWMPASSVSIRGWRSSCPFHNHGPFSVPNVNVWIRPFIPLTMHSLISLNNNVISSMISTVVFNTYLLKRTFFRSRVECILPLSFPFSRDSQATVPWKHGCVKYSWRSGIMKSAWIDRSFDFTRDRVGILWSMLVLGRRWSNGEKLDSNVQ